VTAIEDDLVATTTLVELASTSTPVMNKEPNAVAVVGAICELVLCVVEAIEKEVDVANSIRDSTDQSQFFYCSFSLLFQNGFHDTRVHL
jgi:hypothetical protein